jgi:hypothetical protein
MHALCSCPTQTFIELADACGQASASLQNQLAVRTGVAPPAGVEIAVVDCGAREEDVDVESPSISWVDIESRPMRGGDGSDDRLPKTESFMLDYPVRSKALLERLEQPVDLGCEYEWSGIGHPGSLD